MIADAAELASELEWANDRALVRERSSGHTPPGLVPQHDPPGSFLAALTCMERDRLQRFNAMRPGQAADLCQNPDQRCITTRRGHLMTITKNVGIVFSKRHGRWLCATELLSAMGFPIREEDMRACGAECMFSRGAVAPSTRTLRSMKNQCGYQTAILIALPQLGCRACRRRSTVVDPIETAVPSDFAAARAALMRTRRACPY
jgi:hypothetical protein